VDADVHFRLTLPISRSAPPQISRNGDRGSSLRGIGTNTPPGTAWTNSPRPRRFRSRPRYGALAATNDPPSPCLSTPRMPLLRTTGSSGPYQGSVVPASHRRENSDSNFARAPHSISHPSRFGTRALHHQLLKDSRRLPNRLPPDLPGQPPSSIEILTACPDPVAAVIPKSIPSRATTSPQVLART
jgi:hypothetical protein